MSKTYHGRPLAIDLSTGWSASTGTLITATDPLATIAHDDASSYGIYGNAGGAAGTGQPLRFTARNLPNDVLSINSIKVVVRWWGQDARATVRALLGLAGSYTNSSTWNTTLGAWTTTTTAALVNPRTGSGGVWLPADLHDPTFVYGFEITAWVDSPSPGQLVWGTTIYPLIDYEPIPLQDQGARDAASRRQWFFMTRPPVIERRLRVQDALAADLMDLVGVSHRDGPHASGVGWRSKNWQRELHRVIRRRTDPNTDMVTDAMRAVRPQLCLMRYTARAKTPSAAADGVGFFGPGADPVFTRADVGWVGDPSGGSLIVRAEVDQPRYGLALQPVSGSTEDGLLLEEDGFNELAESSFRNGLTGWTVSAGSGTVEAATSPLRFASIESSKVLKITAGSPHSTETTVTSTATGTYSANDVTSLQIHTQNASGATAGPSVAVQRSVDSNWYDFSTDSWGASRVDNAIASSEGAWLETYEVEIDVGASATTLTVVIVVPASVPSGSIYYVGHVQLTQRSIPQTPIITETSGEGRVADQLTIPNDSGARTLNETRGAVVVVAIPHFWSDVANSFHRVFYVEHDASNTFTLQWDNGNSRWSAVWRAGGSNYEATSTADAPTRGVAVTLGVRWTSDQGELGIANRTLDIFVNGVKGTGISAIGNMTEAASSDWKWGDSQPWAGAIRELHSLAYVPTDEEMARLPRV